MSVKIKFVEAISLPKCPHCKNELPKIEVVSKGIVVNDTIYICPHCKCILSISSTNLL